MAASWISDYCVMLIIYKTLLIQDKM